MDCSKEDIFLSQKKIESAFGNGHSCTNKCANLIPHPVRNYLKNIKMVRDQGPYKVVILTPGFCILNSFVSLFYICPLSLAQAIPRYS